MFHALVLCFLEAYQLMILHHHPYFLHFSSFRILFCDSVLHLLGLRVRPLVLVLLYQMVQAGEDRLVLHVLVLNCSSN